MLTSVDIDSENPFSLPVLGATPKASILARKVAGLNPPPRNLFIGDYSRDGGEYQGRRVGSRNVVFTIDLNPNPALGETVQSLREKLYRAFLDPQVDGDYLKMGFNLDDGRKLFLVGYTETFDGDMFDAETTEQMSLMCPDPYLRDETPTTITHPTGWITVPFTYPGTAETGFEVDIRINSETPTLTLENNGKKIVLNRSFNTGEVVTINTIPGSKSMTLTNTIGAKQSILSSRTTTSPWLQLHGEGNILKVYGTTPGDLPVSIRRLTYQSAYWGI